ncbi:hypothetical protein [Chryseobacterium salipaludis]|uniref:hypothetical protein n=1 Tax=Planobacterium sp. JC490 TaxID=2994550 RepID=UPI002250293D|nr:hypothetical protein [Planobacterium sp. JC490]MCX3297316.1 hypothetical protein [Planobacterium sp. JC490]
MSRTRIVKGKYIKISAGDHYISAEGNIISSAASEVRDHGVERGVFYGSYERLGSDITDDFEISFSQKKNGIYSTVVPLGILDFKGNFENSFFAFNYSLHLGNVDSLKFEVLAEDGTTIYSITSLPELVVTARKHPGMLENIKKNKPPFNPAKPVNIWDWKPSYDPFAIPVADYTKIGSYVILWDGFDNNDIYDSTHFANKSLKAIITAEKNGIKKTKEVEFRTSYKEADWVDVRIDKKNKKLETTLRVNLQNGGAQGLDCTTKDIDPDPKIRVLNTTCDWDKAPKEALHYYKKEPIKSRRKSFDELKSLVIDGLKKHWSRSPKNGLKEGHFINVFDEQFEMELIPIHSSYSALNDIVVLYNTNGTWSRSGNPGFFAKLSYNVGYIKYSDGWGYQNESDEDVIFVEIAAHEIGHPILLAYGSANYSWEHKGSSYLLPQDPKPTSDNDESKISMANLAYLYTFNSTGEY